MLEGSFAEVGGSHPVVLCCDSSAAPALSQRLESRGVEVLHWPGVEVVPLIPGGLDTFPDALRWADLVVFPSTDVVRALRTLFPDLAGALGAAPLRAVRNGRTATLLDRLGAEVEIVPSDSRPLTLVKSLTAALPSGGNVLVLEGAGESDILRTELSGSGLSVRELSVYELQQPEGLRRPYRPVSVVVFGTPSSARALLEANRWLTEVPAVALGPSTATYLKEEAAHPNVIAASGFASTDLLDLLTERAVQSGGRAKRPA